MSTANIYEYPNNPPVPTSPQHPVSPSSAELRERKRLDRRRRPYNKPPGQKNRRRRRSSLLRPRNSALEGDTGCCGDVGTGGLLGYS